MPAGRRVVVRDTHPALPSRACKLHAAFSPTSPALSSSMCRPALAASSSDTISVRVIVSSGIRSGPQNCVWPYQHAPVSSHLPVSLSFLAGVTGGVVSMPSFTQKFFPGKPRVPHNLACLAMSRRRRRRCRLHFAHHPPTPSPRPPQMCTSAARTLPPSPAPTVFTTTSSCSEFDTEGGDGVG